MEEDEKILSKENDIEHTSKQSWFKRHKKLLIFLGVLIVIGLTIGIAAVIDGLHGIEVLGNFITDQILGMQWMNTLLGMAFTGIFGMEFTATRWGGAIQFFYLRYNKNNRIAMLAHFSYFLYTELFSA